MTNSKKNLKEASLDWKLETVQCITYSAKLNKGNKDVLALINPEIKANLISRGYIAQLRLKILNISSSLATINKQQISIQAIVIAYFKISDNNGQTRRFEETFLIADIPQSVVLGMLLLKLGNPEVS